MFGANYFARPYFAQAYGGVTTGISMLILGVICTGRIGEGELGMIDGRENGHVSDTVVGAVEEVNEEEMLVCQ